MSALTRDELRPRRVPLSPEQVRRRREQAEAIVAGKRPVKASSPAESSESNHR